jgi:TfoX/Sxy family transcriptional regulator of competence genes
VSGFDDVADAFADDSKVTKGRMFGSDGLKVAGKVFAMEIKERLVVKLSAERAGQLVNDGTAEVFDPGHGRPMKQWVAVAAGRQADWVALAREACDVVLAGAR